MAKHFKVIAEFDDKRAAQKRRQAYAHTLVKNAMNHVYSLDIEWDPYSKKWVLWLDKV